MITHYTRENMPAAEYHAAPGLSSTTLKALNISPAHTQIPRDAVSPASQRAMDIGTIVHAQVLEGSINLPALGLRTKPEGLSLATKEGKAWKAECDSANLRPIAEEDVSLALTVAAAVINDTTALASLGEHGNNVPELSCFCEYYGQPMKARLDMLNLETGMILDVKTCQDSSPMAFAKDCEKRGYLIQAAHYIRVARMCGFNIVGFRFIAVSTNAPHEVGCYDFSDEHEAWQRVNDRLHVLYQLHADCVRRGVWPKRSHGLSQIIIPAYSQFADKQEAVDLTGIETE